MDVLLALLPGVGFWLIVSVYTSLATGWYRLAKLYRTETRMPSMFHAGLLGMSDDNLSWHVQRWGTPTPAIEGLYLSMPWFFSFLCPPLLIPWKDFVLVPHAELDRLLSLKLYLRNGDNITVTKKLYLSIEPYLRHLPHRPMLPKATARIA
ncbi:MAG TPA: hypothetical protein VFK21_04665 [Gammaproteobacteria bacterium]|nr:hypothetical protein [Gammaproteobacteria bacterium]